jgi:hypothetical protein
VLLYVFSSPYQHRQFAACGWCNPNPTSHDLNTADTSVDALRLKASVSEIPSKVSLDLLFCARSLDFFYEICMR